MSSLSIFLHPKRPNDQMQSYDRSIPSISDHSLCCPWWSCQHPVPILIQRASFVGILFEDNFGRTRIFVEFNRLVHQSTSMIQCFTFSAMLREIWNSLRIITCIEVRRCVCDLPQDDWSLLKTFSNSALTALLCQVAGKACSGLSIRVSWRHSTIINPQHIVFMLQSYYIHGVKPPKTKCVNCSRPLSQASLLVAHVINQYKSPRAQLTTWIVTLGRFPQSPLPKSSSVGNLGGKAELWFEKLTFWTYRKRIHSRYVQEVSFDFQSTKLI